jgi:GH25 family lysozyme M1 (1,4-beta-N-acetylmuramidase)
VIRHRGHRGHRGRVVIAGGALIIAAGLAIPASAQAPVAASAAASAQGIDVSSLQHPVTDQYPDGEPIDWQSVAGSGISFTSIKATEGNYYENSFYQSDVEQATANGLYVMPYVFANPYHTNGTAAGQAEYAWNNEISKVTSPAYGSSDLMLPLAVDLEPDPYVSTEQDSNQCYGLSPSAMVTWIEQFIAEAKAESGKTPIIYTTADWWNACTEPGSTDNAAFGADPLWIASYGVTNPSIPSTWNNWTFWQYTPNGTVSGIGTATDLDELGPTLQVNKEGTAIGPVSIQTLTSLNGQQSVSYSVPAQGQPGSLPPGLSLDTSTGQITGTPTQIGSYNVTVTPSAGAVPSAVSFTWNVHGSIGLTVSNRSGTAGTPVSLGIPVSDPDTGYTPTLTASGLPTGLSMNSSGLITGWPYVPGTYTVKVSASDGLGGTGSASFTWKIGAAADSGAVGQIRQSGGTGKCLEDPGSKTANGSPVEMWTCGSGSDQKWTTVQDGTIRVLGKCLDMDGTGTAANTALELWTCDSGNGAQQWQAASDGELLNPRSGKCVYLATDSAGNGTKPVVHACANDARHHWLRPAGSVLSGKGRCLATAGSTAELVTCANVTAQHWTAETNGTIVQSGKCLAEGAATAGSGVSLGSCSGTAAQWTLVSAGRIATELSNPTSHLCVSVPTSSTASGTALKMESCGNNLYSTWDFE